jgi:putative ABC transport system permease protein
MKRAEQLFRALLRLTPRAFRERYGTEILQAQRARMEQAEARGASAVWALYVKEIAGGVWVALRLWLHALRGGSGATLPRERAGMFDVVRQDVRFAIRTLRRSPAYTATAVVVIAIGIGASTAIFSALNAFFFRPLPFADADRLVSLYETNPEFDWTDQSAAPANLLDWREQVRSFADVAGYSELNGPIAALIDNEPNVLNNAQVTGNFFSVLGVRARLGRTFTFDDTWASETPGVVLSHTAWRSLFSGRPDVIGRSFVFGSTRVEIIGVMPEGFSFPALDTHVWTTFGFAREAREAVWFRRAHWVRPIARLADGVTVAQANADLQRVVRQLQVEYPATNRVMGAGLMPARDFMIRTVRRPLLILFVAVGLLLLLACANVANLTLVRGSERTRELALRHALGAGRVRIARQLLTESLVLAALGGTLGIALGWAGVRGMTALTSLGIAGATTVALDARVVLFAAAISVISGLLFGLAPTIRSTAGDVQRSIGDDSGRTTAGRSGLRTVRGLVIAEVALAVILVVGAGLMTRSVLLVREVNPGFRTEGAIAVQLNAPASRYPSRDHVLAFQQRLLEALEAQPGIERAGMIQQLPLSGMSWTSQFITHGWPPDRVGVEIAHRRADAAYFEALGIPLMRGRMFDRRDGPDAPRVVLINETLAREYFRGENPIGKRIAFERVATDSTNWHEIIGIVRDQHQVSPAQPVRAEVFEHRVQDWSRSNWVVLHTSVVPSSVIPSVRAALRALDAQIPITRVRPLREVWSASIAREQFILTLLLIFGTVALLLAAVGVYGVASQAARRRTREIGIRMALGAAKSDVLRLMLGQSFMPVGIGLAAGLAAALIGTRALVSVLYGIAPNDPLTLAGVISLLALVAALACYLPAWRALRHDPLRSLKQ